MPQIVEVSPPGPGPFLFIATYLPLTHWRHLFQFFRLSSQVQKQLRKAPGVVRFSVRANLFTKNFWTCSVWNLPGAEDRVEGFVYSGVHKDTVNAFARWNNVGQSFTRWTSDSADIHWPEVLQRLEGGAI